MHEFSNFISLNKNEWEALLKNAHITNNESDTLKKLCKDFPFIGIEEATKLYIPLSRVLYNQFKNKKQELAYISEQIYQHPQHVPFIIGLAGSVSVGKTTSAIFIKELLKHWNGGLKVDIVTTDSFLYSNEVLTNKNIMNKKGFPVSYDIKKILDFISKFKSGKEKLDIPIYSHLLYNIVKDKYQTIEQPDILILEGVNVLQNISLYSVDNPILSISDFIDYSIYIDAPPILLKEWFLERFLRLREEAKTNPNCAFYMYTKMDKTKASQIASNTWDNINYKNLIKYIIPTKYKADIIISKDAEHKISNIRIKK
ncbi:MAG: type I pantothenate kinase [Succinivibrionaceae bacterium]